MKLKKNKRRKEVFFQQTEEDKKI